MVPCMSETKRPMITVHLRYFASIREALHCGSEDWQTAATTVVQLRSELIRRGPAYQCLSPDKPVRMALDQVMCLDSAPLTDGCELGFFPPVTGG
jgi:molybdopterin synthase sulfur carrier subunit